MRWIAFIILLLVVTVLQTSVMPFLAVHTIRPDLLVILAVYYALAARTHDALLACWIIGLAIDLTSLSFAGGANVGLHALSLGMIALVIVNLRDLTFRDSVATRLFFTFATKLAVSLLAGTYMGFVLQTVHPFRETLITAIYAAVYTAVLAPYGHWVLGRLRRPLGIGATHRLRVR
jgi:rod shape-determining protein MreD